MDKIGDTILFLQHLTKYVSIHLVPPCLLSKKQNLTTYLIGTSPDTFSIY